MKKKIFVLAMAVMMLAMMLTGCIQNDIGVKMNKDGSGSISATIGIEKNFYENLKQLGSDPFEGKTTIEYTYEDSSYVAYTEVKEYDSYKEMEKALLDMTYDTELIEIVQNAQDEELNEYEDEDITEIEPEEILDITINGEKTEISTKVDDVNTEISEADNHIFSEVNIVKNSGVFYNSYTFNAIMNPQSNESSDYDVNDTFKVTLTVEMPDEITQTKGGKIDGNKVVFDIADITESQELAATCETNNTSIVIGIVIGLVAVLAGLFCIIKFKK